MAAAKKVKYQANWRVDGIADKPVMPGDVVELDIDTDSPLITGGALSPVTAKAAEDSGK